MCTRSWDGGEGGLQEEQIVQSCVCRVYATEVEDAAMCRIVRCAEWMYSSKFLYC